MGIEEAQMMRIKKLETSFKLTEKEMTEAESGANSRVKAIVLKAVEDFRASTKFLGEKTTITLKALKDFQESIEFCVEKADFVTTPYREGINFA